MILQKSSKYTDLEFRKLCFTIIDEKKIFFGETFLIEILWWIERLKKEQHLLEIEIICNIINVFTATFDQMRASLFKIKKNLTPNIWPVDYVYQLLHDNLVCGSSNQNINIELHYQFYNIIVFIFFCKWNFNNLKVFIHSSQIFHERKYFHLHPILNEIYNINII